MLRHGLGDDGLPKRVEPEASLERFGEIEGVVDTRHDGLCEHTNGYDASKSALHGLRDDLTVR